METGNKVVAELEYQVPAPEDQSLVFHDKLSAEMSPLSPVSDPSLGYSFSIPSNLPPASTHATNLARWIPFLDSGAAESSITQARLHLGQTSEPSHIYIRIRHHDGSEINFVTLWSCEKAGAAE